MTASPAGRTTSALTRRHFLGGLLAVPVGLAQARVAWTAGPIVDLRDMADLDTTGNHDVTAALRRAAAQVPAGGGTLQLPRGTFRVSGTIFLQPGTSVRGAGVATTILPVPLGQGFTPYRVDSNPGTYKEFALFVNADADNAKVQDADYHFGDLRLGPEPGPLKDTPAGRVPDFWGGHLIRMHRARKVVIERVAFRHTNDAVAFTRCDDTEVSDCTAENAVNVAFDHWFGGSRHVVRHCIVDGCGTGVMVTGSGTDGQDGRQLGAVVERVRVTGAAQAAIIVNCLTAGSSVEDVKVSDCEIHGGGLPFNPKAGMYAGGMVGSGNIRHAVVAGNRFIDLNGTPVVFQAEAYGQPKKPGQPPSDCTFEGNTFENCRPVDGAGRPSALIVAKGAHETLRGNRAIGGVYGFAAEVDDSSDVIEHDLIPPGRSGLYQTNRATPRIAP
jgi:hypothetical protein